MPGLPLLYRIPPFVLAGLLAVALVLTLACAAWLGRRAIARGRGSELTPLETMASGLLGLLLAFNFSMAQSRFAARQSVLVQEANAIGTAYLRCSVLGADDRVFCRDRLRRYVDLRIEAYAAYKTDGDAQTIARDLAEGERLQRELWSRATRDVQAHSTAANALLLSALNDVIDRDTDRRAELRVAVPQAVTVGLMFTCLAWAALLGYGSVAKHRVSPAAWLIASLLVSTVFGIALDFDHPHSGFIKTTAAEKSMDELRRSLHADAPELAEVPNRP